MADDQVRKVFGGRSVVFRIAQLTIFDAIYTYIVANSDTKAAAAIRMTESALKEKKY